MNSLLSLIIQIINLYTYVLLIYIIMTWLIAFNIINTSNRLVYGIVEVLYKLCEPLLKYIRTHYKKTTNSYRFVLLPETIGSIA